MKSSSYLNPTIAPTETEEETLEEVLDDIYKYPSDRYEFKVNRFTSGIPITEDEPDYEYYDRRFKYLDTPKINLKIFKLWRFPFMHPAFFPFFSKWIRNHPTSNCPSNFKSLGQFCEETFSKYTFRAPRFSQLELTYLDHEKKPQKIKSDHDMHTAYDLVTSPYRKNTTATTGYLDIYVCQNLWSLLKWPAIGSYFGLCKMYVAKKGLLMPGLTMLQKCAMGAWMAPLDIARRLSFALISLKASLGV